MMIFSDTSTEALSSKNPEVNPKTRYVKENFFNKYDILYIVDKVLESSIN